MRKMFLSALLVPLFTLAGTYTVVAQKKTPIQPTATNEFTVGYNEGLQYAKRKDYTGYINMYSNYQ